MTGSHIQKNAFFRPLKAWYGRKDLCQAFFLDRLKKTQGRKNSSLMKKTQNSSKKLKVSAKFEKITTKIDQN